MTREQICKCVKVTDFHKSEEGLVISYTWHEKQFGDFDIRTLNISPAVALEILNKIGEINVYGAAIEYNEETYQCSDFFKVWEFSQWDALYMVIRHEFTKAMDAEIENTDLGKALNNLLKK